VVVVVVVVCGIDVMKLVMDILIYIESPASTLIYIDVDIQRSSMIVSDLGTYGAHTARILLK
jgi:hypothetical protein